MFKKLFILSILLMVRLVTAAEEDCESAYKPYYWWDGYIASQHNFTEPLLLTKAELKTCDTSSEQQSTKSKTYKCKRKGCTKIFSDLHTFKVHRKTHMSNAFTCDHTGCKNVFYFLTDLLEHKLIHYHNCNYPKCNQAFRTTASLKEHVLQKHCKID